VKARYLVEEGLTNFANGPVYLRANKGFQVDFVGLVLQFVQQKIPAPWFFVSATSKELIEAGGPAALKSVLTWHQLKNWVVLCNCAERRGL
jgi:hypothetical protein